jgi:hypothetical protein
MNGITKLHVKRFLKDQMALVPFSVEEMVGKVMAGFHMYRALPDEYKNRWKFRPLPTSVGVGGDIKEPDYDLGYIQRKGEKNHDPKLASYDAKHFFHYNPIIFQDLIENKIPVSDEIYNWLLDCDALWQICLRKGEEFCGALDKEHPGYDFRLGLAHQNTAHLHKLRIIYYDNTGPASRPGILGKGHYDRDALTIHVAESRPGMRINGQPYRVAPGKSLFFCGSKIWNRTKRQKDFFPVWHDIVNEADGMDLENRWTVVFFGHSLDSDVKPQDQIDIPFVSKLQAASI